MGWVLFLDDERYPVNSDWVIARNVGDAFWYIQNKGMPDHMSLDHDLGFGCFTGMDFVKALCWDIQDRKFDLPDGFTWEVHSQNPVGAENMKKYLYQFFDAFHNGEI